MTFPPSAAPVADVRRALAIFAHPDDVDFGCAGTVATWTDTGIEVAYLLVTLGDAGGCGDTSRRELVRRRAEEQRAAAAAVGVRRVDVLTGYADGTLAPTPRLRRDLTAAIRRFRPDRVLTSSPLRRWEHIAGPGHPDHQAVGEAATGAVYPDARNPSAHPDLLAAGLRPWVVREIWYAGGPSPDHTVDVTDSYERKVEAMRAHRSQTAHLDLPAFVRDQLATMATDAGLPSGRLAEAFTVLRTE